MLISLGKCSLSLDAWGIIVQSGDCKPIARAKKIGKRPKLRLFPAVSLKISALAFTSYLFSSCLRGTCEHSNQDDLSTSLHIVTGRLMSDPPPSPSLPRFQGSTGSMFWSAYFSLLFSPSYSHLVDGYSLTSKNEWAPLSLTYSGPRILRSQEPETQIISQGF